MIRCLAYAFKGIFRSRVIKSDSQINVLEIAFFYQVANALRITLVEPLGLTA